MEEHAVSVEGELAPEELDVDMKDSLIRINEPLSYALAVEKMEQGLLVQGALKLTLDCECARCLKPLRHKIDLSHWTTHVPLAGEEKADVVNDVVDLTPYVREDIVLAFPQRPLCGPDCPGLPGTDASRESPLTSNPWAELNKLKLK